MSTSQLLNQLLTMLIGLILPIVVALVTTRVTSAAIKAVLLAALSTITGAVGQYLTSPTGWDWKAAVLLATGTFIAGVGSHFGLWRPTGVTPWAQDKVVTDRYRQTPAA